MKFVVCNLEISARFSHVATDREKTLWNKLFSILQRFITKYRMIRSKINNSKVSNEFESPYSVYCYDQLQWLEKERELEKCVDYCDTMIQPRMFCWCHSNITITTIILGAPLLNSSIQTTVCIYVWMCWTLAWAPIVSMNGQALTRKEGKRHSTRVMYTRH